MKILTIHANFIEFQPIKKALKEAENVPEEKEKVSECLVVFTSVEKADEENISGIVERYVKEIKDIASQVKTKTIVLYPYAHLSSQLASPKKAEQVLEEAEEILVNEKYNVTRAPFGWYKSFTLSCKGHPLSELSRQFTVESNGQKTTTAEVIDISELIKKMSRTHMGSSPGLKGMKSNVELGKELNLYIVNEVVGGGLPLFTPKGATIKREIERFVVDEELKRGYLHTSTPFMAKSDLYKISGHWQHYQDSMFTLKVRDEIFALRPMTCPFQFVIYKNSQPSYRDLPVKYAEISTLFRNEQSGELRGLTRLRQFTLTDAHVICREEQFEEEFEKVLDLIHFLMKKLGITDVWYRFSRWDPANQEKYVNNPIAWERSEKLMGKILGKLKLKYQEGKNEAAFYGPKLDVQYRDVYGKEDTLITVQIDFALPERFDLTYVDKDGKEKRPIVIHRSSAGCTERTISYLLEKTQGKLPLWLNPVQVKIVTITDDHVAHAQKIVQKLKEENFRVELDDRVESMGKKVRDAQLEKVNYIVTIGDKEVKNKVLAVRDREGKTRFDLPVDDFLAELRKERDEKKC